MGKANTSGLIKELIRANGSTTRNKGMEYWPCKTVTSILVSSKTIKCMEEADISKLMGWYMKGLGFTARKKE